MNGVGIGGIDVRDSKKNNGIAETLPKDLQLALLVIVWDASSIGFLLM